MQSANRNRHDVVVVGGRVAGSATAMLLARHGHDVVVLDQASFPSDTVSTHSIARSGVVQLRRWGLLEAVLDGGAPAIRQVTFNAGGESVRRVIKEKSGVDLVVAPRRYVLDTLLATAAEHADAKAARRRTRSRSAPTARPWPQVCSKVSVMLLPGTTPRRAGCNPRSSASLRFLSVAHTSGPRTRDGSAG